MMARMIALAVGAFAAAAIAGCARPTTGDDSNMSCVERLALPVYPPIAASARVAADLAVSVPLAPDGSAQRATIVSTSRGHELFHKAIEVAMTQSAFARRCGGKTVTLVFSFHLEHANGSDLPAVTFIPPNRFEIVTPDRIIDTSGNRVVP